MQHRRTTSAIALAGLLALGTGAPALAADSGSDGNSAAAEQQSGISDRKLEQFAVAMTDVRQIRMEYAPKLQQAESRKKRNELKKAGREEMVQAIRDNGLGVKEYNRIGNRLGNDKQLQQRLRKMMGRNSG